MYESAGGSESDDREQRGRGALQGGSGVLVDAGGEAISNEHQRTLLSAKYEKANTTVEVNGMEGGSRMRRVGRERGGRERGGSRVLSNAGKKCGI